MKDTASRYVDAAMDGDRIAAAAIAKSLIAEDLSPADVILNLLAPSQDEVGRRWQDLGCSIGEEHAATSVTESILAAITVGSEPPAVAGHFVMVCADGEWHSLPAKMAAELLVLQGWRVTVVGAAIPIDHLRTYLAGVDADVIGVSCTIPTNLPGAARSIRAARDLGFTVVAGGQAFGTTPHRARAVGADGWAEKVEGQFDLDAILWDRVPVPSLSGEWSRISITHASIVERAFDWLTQTYGSLPTGGGGWFDHTIADLDDMVGIAAAASLCNDRTLVIDYASWWRSRLNANSLPEAAAAVGLEAVAAALEPVAPVAAAMITDVAHEVAHDTRRLDALR
jgi:methanogenic corrinoid protein MtbC1